MKIRKKKNDNQDKTIASSEPLQIIIPLADKPELIIQPQNIRQNDKLNIKISKKKKAGIINKMVIKSVTNILKDNCQNTPPAPKTDGFSIASLVLGILAVVTIPLGVILGPLAIGFAIYSIKKIQLFSDKYKGAGLALAGLICGIVGLILSVIVIALIISAISSLMYI